MAYTVYLASAGSGKTTRMAGNFIEALLNTQAEALRAEIDGTVAITFTNKAAAEMKVKVIEALHRIAEGHCPDAYKDMPVMQDTDVASKARLILRTMLHSYHLFHITTIDSFIQRIARSIAYELDLPARYDITMDKSAIITASCKALVSTIGKDPDSRRHDPDLASLFSVYMDYLVSKQHTWKLESDFVEKALSLTAEKYHETVERLNSGSGFVLDRAFIEQAAEKYRKLYNTLHADAKHLLEMLDGFLQKHGKTQEIFNNKGNGNYSVILKIADETYDIIKKESAYIFKSWFAQKQADSAIAQDFSETILPHVEEFINRWIVKQDAPANNSGIEYLAYHNFFKTSTAIALMKYVDREVQKTIHREGLVLLEEFTKRMKEKIHNDDIPYIFIRLDNTIQRMFIDEFQDTSRLQWLTLSQFRDNLTAAGKDFYIIGDPKQAIYRWRNGDAGIMLEEIQKVREESEDGNPEFSIDYLDSNFRSLPGIVNFNNEFFGIISRFLAQTYDDEQFSKIQATYEHHEQHARRRSVSCEDGYVCLKYIDSDLASNNDEDSDADESPDPETKKLPPQVLEEVLDSIQRLLAAGFAKREIAILVREHAEASDIAVHLLKAGIDFISDGSMCITTNPAVQIILALFAYIQNPHDALSLKTAVFLQSKYYIKHLPHEELSHIILTCPDADGLHNTFQAAAWFEPFRTFKARLRELENLDLYNLTETLIHIFNFDQSNQDWLYLQFMLEYLSEFLASQSGSISEFLDYVSRKENDLTVSSAGSIDAVLITTIHKSKGRQFPAVIVPNGNLKFKDDKYLEAPLPRCIFPRGFEINARYIYSTNNELVSIPETMEYIVNNHRESILDNVNLLYVAMTRAEDALIVLMPAKLSSLTKKADNREKHTSLASIVYDAYSTNGWNQVLERGTLEQHKPGMQDEENAPVDPQFVSLPWQNRLIIKTRKDRIELELDPARKARTDTGDLIHKYFSEFRSIEDADLIEQKPQYSILPPVDRARLQENARALWRAFENHGWLAMKHRFFEKGILTPEGEKRPDCVFAENDRAIIIDYKTGTQGEDSTEAVLKEKFGDQLAEYAALYAKLGFTHTETWIALPETGLLVNIHSGSSK